MHGYGYIYIFILKSKYQLIENIIIHRQDKVMKGTGKIQKCKARDYFNCQMGENMKVNILMIKKMGTVYFHGVL